MKSSRRGRRKVADVVPAVRSSPSSVPLQSFAQSVMQEIARLRGQIDTYKALIGDLERVQHSMERLHLTAIPGTQAATAAAVLAAHGRPMRLRDLIQAIEARGIRLTGATPRNRRSNLLIAMKRSGQFKRLGEGMYTLAPRAA
jgi:transposase